MGSVLVVGFGAEMECLTQRPLRSWGCWLGRKGRLQLARPSSCRSCEENPWLKGPPLVRFRLHMRWTVL